MPGISRVVSPADNQQPFLDVAGMIVRLSGTKTASMVNEKEQEYLNRLIELPLNSIVDRGAGEMKCRDIGQEIFDHFKKAANGDSLAGIKALQNIADSLLDKCIDGGVRKHYVNRAWKEVNFEPIPFSRGNSYSSLNAKEEEYLEKFIELFRRKHFIYDVGVQKCHNLGQEIFDHFKKAANGDSLAGEEALLKIANQLQYDCGWFSNQYVTRAWRGVGDSNRYWNL